VIRTSEWTDSEKTCSRLRQYALDLLVGRNALGQLASLQIGAFGDAAPGEIGHIWVPLLTSNVPEEGQYEDSNNGDACGGVILSSHLEVLFARVGAVVNAQAKVISVHLKLGPPTEVRPPWASEEEDFLQLASSVSFVDVTEPADPQMAAFPTLDVRLPYDFFYPFVRDDQH